MKLETRMAELIGKRNENLDVGNSAWEAPIVIGWEWL